MIKSSIDSFRLLLLLLLLLLLVAIIKASDAAGNNINYGFGRSTTTLAFATTNNNTPSPKITTSAKKQQQRAPTPLGYPVCDYHQVTIPTSQEGPPRQAISVEDLTPTIMELLEESGMHNGVINVISRHTTTAITINERESRLAKDLEAYFLDLCPIDERSGAKAATHGVRYQHNDIDERPDSEEEAQRCRENGWDIDDPEELQKWRDQEPINAHSHLISMMLGSSEGIPVVNGKMVIGQWQSVMLVDLDGPRDRTVGIQFLGYAAGASSSSSTNNE